MLVAKQNGKLILADEVVFPLKNFTCPGCQHEVIFRHGPKKIPHFAHRHAATCGFSEGETAEHLQGKQQLYNWAKQRGWRPRLEVYLPAIAQRPDLLVEIKGKQVALEFQCSPLSLKRLRERNRGYRRANISVWWILGAPYRRRLGSKKIVQFTQLVAGNPCLLFWNTHASRLELKSQYYRCSYSQFGKGKQVIAKQVAQLLNNQFHPATDYERSLSITIMQQTGKQLAQCPLVCHDMDPSWPALAYPVILWRISVIVKLKSFSLFSSWTLQQWRLLLINCGRDAWLKPGCVAIGYFQQMVIDLFTNGLIAAQVVIWQNKSIILMKRPQWSNQPAEKIAYLEQKQRSV